MTILGGTSKKLETTEATVQETAQPTEQIQTETVEEGEAVFDFQLTEEEIEGAKEVEESQ